MILGIMAALTSEIGDLAAALTAPQTQQVGGRTFTQGRLHGQTVVLALSLWGKVSAATTATLLLATYRVDAIVFTGLAGAIAAHVRPGDVVVASHTVQHDLDPRPLFARYEIGSLRQGILALDPALCAASLAAVRRFLDGGAAAALRAEARVAVDTSPQAHCGLVATGDQFFASAHAVSTLRAALPDTLCVEMEGAAVAQVCAEHSVPCALIRTISDRADEAAQASFGGFLAEAAQAYGRGILSELLPTL